MKITRVLGVMLDPGAYMPTRAHEDDAGLDLYSPCFVMVRARSSATIDTGVHIEIPEGMAGFLKSKSGLYVKHDLTSEGVIDTGYTGSIVVKLYNHGDTDYEIKRGEKCSQLVLVKIDLPELVQVDHMNETKRGSGGFGSTGR